MKYLLDTHALYWRATGSPRLSKKAATLIDDVRNEVLVSAVSAFELSLKHQLGKLPHGESLLRSMGSVLTQMRLTSLPLTVEHSLLAGSFAHAHRDPFDRMLAAQALIEGAVLVTTDPAFEHFPVHTLW